MKAYIFILTTLITLSFITFPALADETDETAPETAKKTVTIKMTGDGECTEILSSDGEDCKIILDCEGLEGLCESEEGVKKIMINCPEGECPELSELGLDIDVLEMTGEEGTVKKKIVICPEGEYPDMGKLKMEFDVDLDEAGLSGEKTVITMVVKDEDGTITIEARGDKDKLKPEIDGILEDLSEDGGKVTTKELEDGYDITIEK